MEFRTANTTAEIEFCKDAILAFRPNVNQDTCVQQVSEMIEEDGYKLVFIPDEENTRAAAIIGYRAYSMLRTEKMIYIDDLFTFPEYRGRGYAGALLGYVEQEAKDQGIRSIHLDSGYQLFPAHKVYLNKGYVLACHHFAKMVP